MNPITPPSTGAPLLQAVVTLGLALLLTHLHRRHGKEHFRWWAVALYARVLSVGAIVSFMLTEWLPFLYLHQVFLGWTALGFWYAAEVFARQVAWRRWFWLLVAFPVAWSAVAIYVLDNFALAAGPAVVFLAIATGWAGLVFLDYRRRTTSPASGFLAAVMFLWALHHLDYPLLRARGAWDPWGYYLDILFVLAMGAGVLLLVIEEQREGLRTLSALSGAARADDGDDSSAALLGRPLSLRGVRGTALLRVQGAAAGASRDAVTVEGGAGDARDWIAATIPAVVQRLAREAASTGRPRLEGTANPARGAPPFTAALPLGRSASGHAVLAIVGDIAAPFAALDDSILTVVGEQIGLALERAELGKRLAQRTADLERLSVRMLQEHEAQRRRLGRELHDETAQVFSALKMQLGSLREVTEAALHDRFDRLIDWVDRGSNSIRSATEGLRPAVLDDLGLLPALRALVSDVREWSGMTVSLRVDDSIATQGREEFIAAAAEVALFRALQEALSNVVRHAQASTVAIVLSAEESMIRLVVRDDGVVRDASLIAGFLVGPGRSGLVGMRERLASVGGTLELSTEGDGLILTIAIPRSQR